MDQRGAYRGVWSIAETDNRGREWVVEVIVLREQKSLDATRLRSGCRFWMQGLVGGGDAAALWSRSTTIVTEAVVTQRIQQLEMYCFSRLE